MIMNEEILKEFCDQYNFTLDLIGNYVRIKSKNDTWYMPNLEYTPKRTRVRLLHANAKGGKESFHFQGNFNSYKETFEYIYGHDNKLSNSFEKVFKINNLLKRSVLNEK